MLQLMIVEGSVATVMAAMLASLGAFLWPMVFIFSVVADLVGNVFLYWIGYQWGMKFVDGFGRHLGINEKRVLGMEEYFQAHGGKTLFVAKSIAGVYILAFVTAGIVKMDFKKFLLYSLLSGVIWSGFLVMMGYSYGYLWRSASHLVSRVGETIFLLVIIFLFARKAYKKKHL